MKNLSFLFFTLIVTMTFLACDAPQEKETAESNVSSSSMKEAKKELRHVVIFKFKDDAPEAEVQKIHDSFYELPKKIPVIKDFEWGINDSPEDFHQDFTHCYLLTFESEEDRDSIYAPHPDHVAFGESLQPYLEKVFVVDYWANK